jgi:hypothetical protein
MKVVQEVDSASRWVTVAKAAILLDRSENAVRHLIKKGKLRVQKPDGRVMIDRSEIFRFMNGVQDHTLRLPLPGNSIPFVGYPGALASG